MLLLLLLLTVTPFIGPAAADCIGPAVAPGAAAPVVGQQCPNDQSVVTAARQDARGLFYIANKMRFAPSGDGSQQVRSQVRLLAQDGSCTVVAGTTAFFDPTFQDAAAICAPSAASATTGLVNPSALAECFVAPTGLALFPNGDLLLVDTYNHRVVRILALDNSVVLVAGVGRAGYAGDSGPAAAALLDSPYAAAVDAAGRVLISDYGNSVVRGVSAGGVISTVMGNASSDCAEPDGVPLSADPLSACLAGPMGLAVLRDGTGFVVADTLNNRVVGVSAAGAFSMLLGGNANMSAGNYSCGPPGGADADTAALGQLGCACVFGADDGALAPAAAACVSLPTAVAVDPASGDLFVADGVGGYAATRVRRVSAATHRVTTVPVPLAAFVADLAPSAASAAAAGGGGGGGFGLLVTSSSAAVNLVPGPAFQNATNTGGGSSGTVALLALNASGAASAATLARTDRDAYCGDGGPALQACLQAPVAIARAPAAADGDGSMYVADAFNGLLRRVYTNGTIVRIAGDPAAAASIGGVPPAAPCARDTVLASQACLQLPWGLAVAGDGDVVFAEGGLGQGSVRTPPVQRIRRLSVARGVITTLAGSARCPALFGGAFYDGGGNASAACLSSALFVAVVNGGVGSGGSVLFSDNANGTIWRVFTGNGSMLRVAGSGRPCAAPAGSAPADGPALDMCLLGPAALVAKAGGSDTVYFLETGSFALRALVRDAAGVLQLSTLAGTGALDFGAVFIGATAPVRAADTGLGVTAFSGLALDPTAPASQGGGGGGDVLVIADSAACIVLRFTPGSGSAAAAGASLELIAGNVYDDTGDGGPASAAAFSIPSGVAFDGFGNLWVADAGASRVRAVVSQARFPCPAGYACPCAAPVPCTGNASIYCPVNTATPLVAVAGFYAVTGGGSGAGGLQLQAAQRPCPAGAYCNGGVRTLCAPGSYGLAGQQALPSACTPCRVGTYSVAAGASSAATCLPCPANSGSAAAGAFFCPWWPANTSSAAVVVAAASAANTSVAAGPVLALQPCPGDASAFSFPGPLGAGACIALPDEASVTVLDGGATVDLQLKATLNLVPDYSTLALQLQVAIPVALIIMLPAVLAALLLLLARLPCKAEACARPRRAVDAALHRLLYPVLRASDQMGDWKVGHAKFSLPVHWEGTELGGALSLAAVAVIAAFMAVIVIQFNGPDNQIVSKFVLPDLDASLADFALLPFTALPAGGTLGGLVPGAGLAVQVAAMGPRCGAVALGGPSAAAGFVASVAPVGTAGPAAASAFLHTFTCAACALGDLSALTATWDGSCQTLAMAAAAVGAQGAVTAFARVAQPPPGAFLVGATLGVTPAVEVALNHVSGTSTRGILLSDPQWSVATAASAQPPAAVTLTVTLFAAPTYSGVEVFYKFFAVDLVYQLLATLAFGAFFTYAFLFVIERYKRLELLEREREAREDEAESQGKGEGEGQRQLHQHEQALAEHASAVVSASSSASAAAHRLAPATASPGTATTTSPDPASPHAAAPSPRQASPPPRPRRHAAAAAASSPAAAHEGAGSEHTGAAAAVPLLTLARLLLPGALLELPPPGHNHHHSKGDAAAEIRHGHGSTQSPPPAAALTAVPAPALHATPERHSHHLEISVAAAAPSPPSLPRHDAAAAATTAAAASVPLPVQALPPSSPPPAADEEVAQQCPPPLLPLVGATTETPRGVPAPALDLHHLHPLLPGAAVPAAEAAAGTEAVAPSARDGPGDPSSASSSPRAVAAFTAARGAQHDALTV